MPRYKIIQKGDMFKTKAYNAYEKQILFVTNTESPEIKDGYIHFRTQTKVHNKINHRARVWWFNEYCKRVTIDFNAKTT